MRRSEPDPEILKGEYSARLPLLAALAGSLEQETKEALSGLPHIERISFRVKEPDSFVAKAMDPAVQPRYTDPIAEIEDQVAGRVIVLFLSVVDEALGMLDRTFTKVEVTHKRPPKDEEFGYESHHIICTIPPQAQPEGWEGLDRKPNTFELQVRTLFMHAWAEPQHQLAYKSSKGLPGDVRRELSWVAASAWGADRALLRVEARLRESSGSNGIHREDEHP